MKKILFFLIIAGSPLYAQSVIGHHNSGSLATNTYSHGVGEIYVTAQNQNNTSSGTLAAATQVVFGSLSINDMVIADGVTYYPNPVENYLTVIVPQNLDITKAEMYDAKGMKVNIPFTDNTMDMGGISKGIYFITFPGTTLKPVKIVKN